MGKDRRRASDGTEQKAICRDPVEVTAVIGITQERPLSLQSTGGRTAKDKTEGGLREVLTSQPGRLESLSERSQSIQGGPPITSAHLQSDGATCTNRLSLRLGRDLGRDRGAVAADIEASDWSNPALPRTQERGESV